MSSLEKLKSFLDLLSETGQELVPVNYRLMEAEEVQVALSARPITPAGSKFYHTDAYRCFAYHKPISKCCTEDE
jgi:hypothetical protein